MFLQITYRELLLENCVEEKPTFYQKKKVGQTISDNRPQKQIELSSEDNFDDWELQWRMRDVVSVSFHVAFLSSPTPPHAHSVSLWWSRYMMWPVDAHLGSRKTHFSYAFNFKRMTSPPPVKVLLIFSPFLSHISSCCSPSFFLSVIFFFFFLFTISIVPTQGHPGHPQLQLYAKLS